MSNSLCEHAGQHCQARETGGGRGNGEERGGRGLVAGEWLANCGPGRDGRQPRCRTALSSLQSSHRISDRETLRWPEPLADCGPHSHGQGSAHRLSYQSQQGMLWGAGGVGWLLLQLAVRVPLEV